MTNIQRLLATAVVATSLTGPAHAQQRPPDAVTAELDQSATADPAGAVPEGPQPTPAVAPEPADKGFVARIKRNLTRNPKDNEIKDDPVGVYPRIGGLTTGSGLAVGAGYRTHVLTTPFYADVSGVLSTKRYVAIDGRLRWPSPAPRRLELWTTVKLRRFTQEDYFGFGNQSPIDGRTDYAIHSTDVGGEAIVHVTKWLQIGTDIGYFRPTIAAGTDPNFPSIELGFTDATAPGLTAQPDYLHYGVTSIIDYRDQRGNPRSGGFYRAMVSAWDDRTLHAYNFRRFDGELHQFVPLGSKRHVLAVRASASVVNNSPGDRVPFYFYPYVGGANTVRSYREFRFREENAMSLSGEYRFGLMKYVQLVAFADAGKVGRNWQQLNLRDLKTGYGGGVRAGTSSRTFVRIDVGTGAADGEGNRVYLLFFPSF